MMDYFFWKQVYLTKRVCWKATTLMLAEKYFLRIRYETEYVTTPFHHLSLALNMEENAFTFFKNKTFQNRFYILSSCEKIWNRKLHIYTIWWIRKKIFTKFFVRLHFYSVGNLSWLQKRKVILLKDFEFPCIFKPILRI